MDYIHYKLLKYGLACSLMAWLHYGFGRYVKAGVYPLDYGDELMCDDGVGSEKRRSGNVGLRCANPTLKSYRVYLFQEMIVLSAVHP